MENRIDEKMMHDRFMSRRMEEIKAQLRSGQVVRLGRKGAELLAERGFKVCFNCIDNPPKLDPFRTILAVDARIGFLKMGLVNWQANRHCVHDSSLPRMRGDGVIAVEKKRIAIELVTSMEQKSFYEKRFSDYENDPSVDVVLYFVCVYWIRDILISMTKSRGKIYFIHLGEFLVNRESTSVAYFGEGRKLTLRDILPKGYNSCLGSIFTWVKNVLQRKKDYDQGSKELNFN